MTGPTVTITVREMTKYVRTQQHGSFFFFLNRLSGHLKIAVKVITRSLRLALTNLLKRQENPLKAGGAANKGIKMCPTGGSRRGKATSVTGTTLYDQQRSVNLCMT